MFPGKPGLKELFHFLVYFLLDLSVLSYVSMDGCRMVDWNSDPELLPLDEVKIWLLGQVA